MGRSRLIPYIVRYSDTSPFAHHTHPEYSVKHCGKPTEANLRKWVQDFEDSLRPNGINEHLGIFSIKTAEIYDQRKDEVVASIKPERPMFQVIEPLPEGHPLHCHTHGFKTFSEREAIKKAAFERKAS